MGYRKSYYQEDDNRINVTTDTLQFDVGLRDNVRLNGDVVIDAISGATPTGAPPQTQWPFPTFNNLYQSAYQSAYASQYNQFIANNQIYVDSGLETYQQLTNDAAGLCATDGAEHRHQQRHRFLPEPDQQSQLSTTPRCR